jgi:hypothetical protein
VRLAIRVGDENQFVGEDDTGIEDPLGRRSILDSGRIRSDPCQ